MHQLMEGELWPLLQLMRLTSHFRTRSVGVQTEAGDMPVPSVPLPLSAPGPELTSLEAIITRRLKDIITRSITARFEGIITQAWDVLNHTVELITTIGRKYHRHRDFPTAAAQADLENAVITAAYTASSEVHEFKSRLENDLNCGVNSVVLSRGPAFAPM